MLTVSFTHDFSIFDGCELAFEAEVEVLSLGYPGTSYQSNGDPGDPPEGPEIELVALYKMHEGKRVETLSLEALREEEWERLYDKVCDLAIEKAQDEMASENAEHYADEPDDEGGRSRLAYEDDPEDIRDEHRDY